MSAEEIKQMADDIKAGKNVVSGEAEVEQSTEFAATKEAEEAEKEPEVDYTVPDKVINTSEEDSNEPQIEAPKEEVPVVDEPEAGKTINIETPEPDEIKVEPISVPGLDELNATLSPESPSIDVTPTYEPSLNVNNISLESPADMVPNDTPATPDFSYDMPMDGGYSFDNTEQPILSNIQDENNYGSNDYGSNDEFDALLSKYIGEGNEYENKQRNTLLPQSREEGNKLIDEIFKTRPIDQAIAVVKEQYGIEIAIREQVKNHLLKVREEAIHRSVQIPNDKLIAVLDAKEALENVFSDKQDQVSSSLLQSPDEFGYIAKDPTNMSYSQQNGPDMDLVQNYEQNQNIIKGNFGYEEAQEQNNNFGMTA